MKINTLLEMNKMNNLNNLNKNKNHQMRKDKIEEIGDLKIS